MPLPELWFVYDNAQGDFTIFLSEIEAQTAYDKLIKEINDSVGTDEYEGDEQIYIGRVHKRAEVVPVGVDEDNGDELWSLVSYGLVTA